MTQQKELQKLLDQHEQCRQGSLMCPKCGKPMDMYYEPMCFWCTKPASKSIEYYNLICVLNYLDNIEPGTKDTIWEILTTDDVVGNDTFGYYVSPLSDYEICLAGNMEQLMAIKLLFDHYPDADKYLWQVAW